MPDVLCQNLQCQKVFHVKPHIPVIGKGKYCSRLCRQVVRHASRVWDTPEYHAWEAMAQRCSNPHHPVFIHYGARGITICNRWRTSFRAFLDDMGLRPTPKHTLERLNNNASYCPENCEWIPYAKQNRNTRHNRNLTFQGQTLCLTEWAERLGISRITLSSRLRLGWTIEDALMKPVPQVRHKRSSGYDRR